MKCNRTSDGRKLDHITLQDMRQLAVKAVRDGQTVTSVAAAFGLNVRTVFTWLAKFSEGGEEALRAKPISGRPALVTNEEMRWIGQAVRNSTPQHFGFDYGLWTSKLIVELVSFQYGKSLSPSGISRVMKLLGFLVPKPFCQARHQDAALVRQWKAETYPRIKAEAQVDGAMVYFADEVGIQSDYYTGPSGTHSGETPVVTGVGGPLALNMVSAVSPRGDFRFMVRDGPCTPSTFEEFLGYLMIGATRPALVIVDDHPIHMSPLVQDIVEKLDGQLKLFYLPSCLLRLKPDEQVSSLQAPDYHITGTRQR